MKKVIAFVGTASKQNTLRAVRVFEENLKRLGDVELETIFLNQCHLEYCTGCMLCFNKGEALCPLKDDRDALISKIEDSDGVVFATPSYAFQVTARMKNLLDRLAFLFHRPRFFGKTFTAILTEGMPAGGSVLKYLESSGENLGFDVTEGCRLWTLEPMSEKRQQKFDRRIKEAAERFHRGLMRNTAPVPSLFRLMLFRTSRSGIRNAKVQLYDYGYFRDKGWFESDYYYETRLNLFKKLCGSLFDFMGRQVAKRM